MPWDHPYKRAAVALFAARARAHDKERPQRALWQRRRKAAEIRRLDHVSLVIVATVVVAVAAVHCCPSIDRDQHYLTRRALHSPGSCAFMYLYGRQDAMAFLNTMFVSPAMFQQLLRPFTAKRPSPATTGRPRILTPVILLGLALTYLSSTMHQDDLCLVFGLTPASVSSGLWSALECLREVLHTLPLARIAFPTPRRMRELADILNATEPRLEHAWGMIDGTHFDVVMQIE